MVEEPYSNSPPHQQHHSPNPKLSLILVYTHLLNEYLELRSREWLRKCISKHKLCRDVLDGNESCIDEFLCIVVLDVNML